VPDPLLPRLLANLAMLRQGIEEARRSSPVAAPRVDLLVVTKSIPTTWLASVAAAGITDVAENRVQAAQERRPAGPAGLRWHLIGHLQRNKAARAVQLFDAFHALDSLALAREIASVRAGNPSPWPVYLQVNAADDPRKGGIAPSEVPPFVKALADIPEVRPVGFMTMGRQGSSEREARDAFRTLREVRDDVVRTGRLPHPPTGLSMGMSDDHLWAVAEGATVVRLGSAVFAGLAEAAAAPEDAR
jgi:PLP dependent protein